jgi:uroporphyrinogen-III synthase
VRTSAEPEMRNDLIFITGHWKDIPFYVVGKATAASLPRYVSNILGEDSGTGEALAKFIVQHRNGQPTKLLYLKGDKNKDTVPRILKDAGIDLHTVQVYGTQGSSQFPMGLEKVLRQMPTGKEVLRLSFQLLDQLLPERAWWIVFFAPSAAAFVLPHLRGKFDLSSANVHVAAIGPVTSSYLKDELGLEVKAVAQKPSAENLISAIEKAIQT